MQNKSALIVAGGTGGHIFPGLALADALRSQGWSVNWLGTLTGLESRLVPKQNIQLHTINVRGIRGKGIIGYVSAPLNIVRAVAQAVAIIKNIKPSVVIGFGGFVAGPGGVAAKLLGLPLIIHEQNAVAGTTNRMLAKFANHVCAAFPNVIQKAQVVGNPVRADIGVMPLPAARFAERDNVFRILVVGGSRGAKAINELVPAGLMLLDASVHYAIRHQAGAGHAQSTRAHYQQYRIDAEVDEFIDDMASAYAWADMVICRAGALTVSELASSGLPALLVPFPYAIDDHQTANATFLVKAKAGIVIQQRDLTPEKLAQSLMHTFFDRKRLLTMAENARSCSQPRTLDLLTALCEESINEK